ncbi:MAG TPA: hypothetical protein VGZ27_10060 [Vicinamibacterales bacterium]|nr:hypothetical protein [Vicinamibacterales bacterium]
MRSRCVLGVAACVLALAVPARADLHYTMHTEARQVTPTEDADAMLVMAGDMLVRAMFPEGPADSIYWLSDKGTRIELTKANVMMPAGSVMLHLADGTMAILNPKDRTYWKIPVAQMMPQMMIALSQMKPDVSFVHSGEFATIAGVRAEHITSRTTIDLPAPPPGAPIPPGMPTSITMSADLWMADAYANYSALASAPAAMMGLDVLVPPGFMVKSVMRISMIPAYEIEWVVTEIKEEPAPADTFEIPADYTEIPAPFRGVAPRSR